MYLYEGVIVGYYLYKYLTGKAHSTGISDVGSIGV